MSIKHPLEDPQSVRVLSIDLDDTLWDVMPVLLAAEERLRAWLEQHCPGVTARYSPQAARQLRERLDRAHPERAHDLSWLRIRTLEIMLRDCGYATQLAMEAFEVFLEARNRVQLFGDVMPALQALRQRFKMVALTNGNAELERVGLAEYFDYYLNAARVGAAKPDSRMFEAVEAATGCRGGDILHVGDDPLRDILGAARAGLRTVWVNRKGEPWPSGHPWPDAQVPDLLSLSRMLLKAG